MGVNRPEVWLEPIPFQACLAMCSFGATRIWPCRVWTETSADVRREGMLNTRIESVRSVYSWKILIFWGICLFKGWGERDFQCRTLIAMCITLLTFLCLARSSIWAAELWAVCRNSMMCISIWGIFRVWKPAKRVLGKVCFLVCSHALRMRLEH